MSKVIKILFNKQKCSVPTISLESKCKNLHNSFKAQNLGQTKILSTNNLIKILTKEKSWAFQIFVVKSAQAIVYMYFVVQSTYALYWLEVSFYEVHVQHHF